MKRQHKIVLILLLGTVLIACSTFGVSREEGGALLLETNIPLSAIESAIENAVDLTQVVGLQLDLRDGYIFVSASSIEVQGITVQDVSFHLELSAVNGRLAAEVTHVDVSGNLIDENAFEIFNQMIAERIAQSQEQMEYAELVDASVTMKGVSLVWRLNNSGEN